MWQLPPLKTDEIIIYIGFEKKQESSEEPTEPSSEEPTEPSSSEAPTEPSSSEEPTEPSSSEEPSVTATIPEVIGDTEEEAKHALRAFKTIQVEYEVVTDPNQIGVVVRVTPGVGETVDVNTVVTIYIGIEAVPEAAVNPGGSTGTP